MIHLRLFENWSLGGAPDYRKGKAAQSQDNQHRGDEAGNWGMEKTAKEKANSYDCLQKGSIAYFLRRMGAEGLL